MNLWAVSRLALDDGGCVPCRSLGSDALILASHGILGKSGIQLHQCMLGADLGGCGQFAVVSLGLLVSVSTQR